MPKLRFQDLRNDRIKNKHLIHFRGWLTFGTFGRAAYPKKSIRFEVCSSPSIGYSFSSDGYEHEWCLGFWFILKFYIHIYSILPKWLYPENGQKELSIKFHNSCMWIKVWDDPWNPKYPEKWYRNFSIDFERLFLGDYSTFFHYKSHDEFLLPFLEANYNVVVIKKERHAIYKRRISRLFNKKEIFYECMAGVFEPVKKGYKPDSYDYVKIEHWCEELRPVEEGEDGLIPVQIREIEGIVIRSECNMLFHPNAIKKVFRDIPVPCKGKGGDDAMRWTTFHAKRNNIDSCLDAALLFWGNCMKGRNLYGTKNWVPKKVKRVMLIEKYIKRERIHKF